MAGNAAASQTAFLLGGGEMGERMRAFDWSRTPLGPAARWPQSLKTAVRIMLTSRQPMFVWWGRELINLYNDAYRAIVGGKHPRALGQPASVVWEEIWDQVRPRAESAILRNEGTYDEALRLIMRRHGYPEETYYTFSYSPVPDDAGGTGGILCANSDDTQRIIGERQLALLRELAARTADARTLDAACRLSAGGLGTNPYDLPFALIYLVDPESRCVALAAASGIAAGHAAVPHTIDLDDASIWPIAAALDAPGLHVVGDLTARFPDLPAGAWDRAPQQAVVAPIASGGVTGKPGILIAGLNPYRLFDDRYRGFIELIASQISASFANARAYEEERRRAEALADLDRAKTAFFSNVSHEFRTPLTLMLGPLEDLIGQPEGTLRHEQREQLVVMHRNGQRLLRLVNTLLDFSRLEAGRVQASFAPLDLASFTAELASMFRSAVDKARLRLRIDCPPLREPVFVDRDMWEKIVLNLLSNAFKFTLAGEIEVSLRATPDGAELAVRDTGTGIPEADLPYVFDRFHRVDGTRGRTHEGSGIGLALVRELIQLHGGTVSVASVVGQGSTFRVTVPFGSAHLAADRLVAAPLRPSLTDAARPFVEESLRWLPDAPPEILAGTLDAARSPHSAAQSAARPYVLWADDNADMRDYVRRLLSAQYEVAAVGDGDAALAAARARRPDLILSDVMMPGMDGFALLRQLRADEALRSVPIVLLSARAGEEARIEGLEAGADDYLIKPFSARELLARVGAALTLDRVRREARRRESALQADTSTALAALRTREQWLGLATQTGKLGIWDWDVAANRVAWTESLYAIHGVRREDFDETVDGFTALIHPDDRAAVTSALEHALADAAPYEVEFRAVRPDGEVIWLFTNAAVLREDGRAVRMLGATLDVTQRKCAEMALAKAAEELRDADQRKNEFLATLAHELRNPLAPIANGLAILRLAGQDAAAAERSLAMMERQLQRMVRLIDDLLDLSRISRGSLELRSERVDLARVVRDAIETSSPLIEQGGHTLSIALPPEPIFVDADVTRLAQVLGNLLNNAAKYTPRGGRIWLTVERAGTEAVIRVRDTGIGIQPHELPRVFDMFTQVDRSLEKSQGGLGIGLSIVQRLVEMHGGTVEAHSAGRTHGSEFIVRLPVLDAAARAGGAGDGRAAQPSPAPRKRVLVADDNEDAAASLAIMLELMGHEVRTARDGQEAAAAASAFRPDMILLDIGMPKLNGYDACRQIRAESWSRDVIIVALTGWGQDEDEQRSRAAGFDHHVVKPAEPAAIAALLARPADVPRRAARPGGDASSG